MNGSLDCCEVACIHEEQVAEAKKMMLPDETIVRLAEIFKVLGDPTRMKIIIALLQHELCVCDLAAVLNMSQSAVSHQLRVLRSLRLVKNNKIGKVVYYSLDDEHISRLVHEGLDHVGHIG